MIDLSNSTVSEVVAAAEVLATLDVFAREEGVDYLVVGATARTLLSLGLLGELPERRTSDIDIAVCVGSWADYERVTDRMEPIGRSVHKFSVNNIEVDVVPFGGIEGDDRTISWPDDHRMNVFGLSEAVSKAIAIRLPGDLLVRAPSVPVLAALKLVTWWDRRSVTTRDAIDLAAMSRWYSAGASLDRLYEHETEALARWDFDPALAGAWLLGIHMAQAFETDGVVVLLDIVDSHDAPELLVADSGVAQHGRELLDALVDGLRHA